MIEAITEEYSDSSWDDEDMEDEDLDDWECCDEDDCEDQGMFLAAVTSGDFDIVYALGTVL